MKLTSGARKAIVAIAALGVLCAVGGCSTVDARAQAVGSAWAQVQAIHDEAVQADASSAGAFAKDARSGNLGQLVHLRIPGHSRLAQPPFRSGIYSVHTVGPVTRLRYMVLGNGVGLDGNQASVYLCVIVTWHASYQHHVRVEGVQCPTLFTQRLARLDKESLLPFAALSK